MGQEGIGELIHAAAQLGVVDQDGGAVLHGPAACRAEFRLEPANRVPRVGSLLTAPPLVASKPADPARQDRDREHDTGQEAEGESYEIRHGSTLRPEARLPLVSPPHAKGQRVRQKGFQVGVGVNFR